MKQKIVISELFHAAWTALKAQLWILVGLLVGYTIIYLLLSIVPPTNALGIILTLIGIVFSLIFGLGYAKNLLQAYDGEEPQFSAYSQQFGKIITYFVTSILYSIIVAIGTVILIIPGIYLALRLQFCYLYIVDENAGIIDSLKKSWAATEGQVIPLFVLALAFIGLMIVGIIALGIGIFIATPLIGLMLVGAFRRLNAPETIEEVKEEVIIEN